MTLCRNIVATLLLAVSTASAALINGDFEAGDFNEWTVTDLNGVSNPALEPFDVSGAGASSSARFQVGRSGSPFGPAGGALLTQVFLLPFDDVYSLSASIAAWLPLRIPAFSDAHGGRFDLLLDSAVLDSVLIGTILSGDVLRDELRYEGSLTSGQHELAIRIRRDFAADAGTPFQFVDNVVVAPLTQSEPLASPAEVQNPEPSTLILIGTGCAALLLGRRVR